MLLRQAQAPKFADSVHVLASRYLNIGTKGSVFV